MMVVLFFDERIIFHVSWKTPILHNNNNNNNQEKEVPWVPCLGKTFNTIVFSITKEDHDGRRGWQ
jgi:hypothetical protein